MRRGGSARRWPARAGTRRVHAHRPHKFALRGDEVFGFLLHANPTARDGAWGELVTVTEELSIAPAPAGVDLAASGTAPLAGIAALTLVAALELVEGDTLLIVGAAGGVGSLAVQLAAQAGARVIAPALSEDESYLRELGVSDVIPRVSVRGYNGQSRCAPRCCEPSHARWRPHQRPHSTPTTRAAAPAVAARWRAWRCSSRPS